MIRQLQPAGACVLIVDDTDASRYVTARLLRAAGAKIIEAITGAQALELAPAADVIVLDVNLPDIDGYEVCRRMRQRDDTRSTPIVHLSAAYVTDNNKVFGLESGADAYLTHPAEPEMLVATINTLLRARRAEEENRRTTRLLGSVFRTAAVGIAVVDADNRLIEMNPAFCAMLGSSREALQDRPLAEVAGAAFATAVNVEESHEVAGLLQRADGSALHCEWNVVSVGTGERVISVSDMTRRRELEQEREALLDAERHARADAERANASKDDFLAVLSHELRNPLSNILGWSNIARRVTDPAQRDQALAAINTNVYTQVQLVEDLLDVSRIAEGKLRLERHPVDLSATVREAIQSAGPAALNGDVSVRHAPQAPLWVSADPGRLQQIVANLLSNAIKFSPRGSIVEVTVSAENGRAQLLVADNGVGIAPDLLPHIFERFRQGDSSTTRRTSGLGLGLAIVKSLVGLHGGSISAYSAGTNQGTRFIVDLPLTLATATSPQGSTAGTPAPERPLAGRRILVVDDSPEARRILAFALEEWGAAATVAGSAQEALELLEQATPDLLISDISMPDTDGFELIRQIRARGHQPTTLPAIALTAFAGKEDHRRILMAGFQDHVSKPVDIDLLLQSIQRSGERQS
jgi:PAS domain S-box-containing protein